MAKPESALTDSELADFQRLAGFMIPASTEFQVPGADDSLIFADIMRSLGRDEGVVWEALAVLSDLAGGGFAQLDEVEAQALAMAFLGRAGPNIRAMGQAVLQCYYCDDRVFLALGREPRAPFPVGHKLEQGDFSLLDAVRDRPQMWRDLDGTGG